MYSKTELAEIRKRIYSRYPDFKCDMKPLQFGWILPLKPLSSITDEDAIEVAKIGKCKYCIADIRDLKPHLLRALDYSSQWNGKTWIAIYQYLQLKGYAIEQTVILNGKPITLSVEQQIESLIIETKN